MFNAIEYSLSLFMLQMFDGIECEWPIFFVYLIIDSKQLLSVSLSVCLSVCLSDILR